MVDHMFTPGNIIKILNPLRINEHHLLNSYCENMIMTFAAACTQGTNETVSRIDQHHPINRRTLWTLKACDEISYQLLEYVIIKQQMGKGYIFVEVVKF